MVNKSIKALLVALVAAPCGAIRANAQASDGGTAVTQPITVNACSTGGMTATSSGTCTGNTTVTNTITSGTAGRARGDVVRLNGTFKGDLSTAQQGRIQIPQVGQIHEYRYGKITLVIGSFNLQDKTKNPRVGNLMNVIISEAARKNPWANTFVWYGRRLDNKTVEIGETLTEATDLANTFVDYKPVSATEFYIQTPASKDAGPQTYLIDLDPIFRS